MAEPLKEKQFFVQGMHCASCELLIENTLLEKKNIKSVDVSSKDNSVLIEYVGKSPTIGKLNKIFAKDNYSFSNKNEQEKTNKFFFSVNKDGDIIWNWEMILANLPVLIIVGLVIWGFFKFGSSSMARLSVNSESSFSAFFIFGIIAGFSTCSALIGGIVLSMSKQWGNLYNKKSTFLGKIEPHLLFNGGRILSYGLVGVMLGALGNIFQISVGFSALLTIGVSIFMFLLALQMLNISWAKNFQFKAPKFLTRNMADERNFTGRQMPTLMGAGTVLLPCGFTLTTQGLALLSGDPIKGGLIMLAFVLGTTPILFLIGMSSLMFNSKPHIAATFTKIAGTLVILFAFFNINAAFNVLGLPNFSSYLINGKSVAGSVQAKGQKQIIAMTASAQGYEPNYFQVKVGTPVEWQITDEGASGCTNSIIARDLFDGQVKVVPGQTVSKTFTPTKTGKFRFSCWMGMATGIIEIVK